MDRVISNIVLSVLGQIGKSLVVPIGRHIGYLFCSKRYVKGLSDLVQELDSTTESLRERVAEEKRLGKDIIPLAENWLQYMDCAEELQKRMNLNRCVSVGLGYKLSKEADSLSGKIQECKLDVVKMERVALPPRLPTMNFTSTEHFMRFGSIELTMTKILDALRDESCDIVTVYGMGGVGKTMMVEEIAAENALNFHLVVKAVVSQQPDVKRIQGEIASMLKLKLDEAANESGRAGQLCAALTTVPGILAIFDDAWEALDLAGIGVPKRSDHPRCKIILNKDGRLTNWDGCQNRNKDNGPCPTERRIMELVQKICR